jgi:hypothetical protein
MNSATSKILKTSKTKSKRKMDMKKLPNNRI